MSDSMNYDAKKFICAPWNGKRGPAWSRYFKPDFENALRMQKDSFNSIHQTLEGLDFGGWQAAAPAHIAGAGALAAQKALRWNNLALQRLSCESLKAVLR